MSTPNTLATETFKNASGDFIRPVGYDYGDGNDDGECVRYVRYEIGDGNMDTHYDACNQLAYTCYNKASTAGYAVGQIARVGAIVVFKRNVGIYTYAGHVGIIKSVASNSFVVRESNVVDTHVVGERTIQKDDPAIKGYIYPKEPPWREIKEYDSSLAIPLTIHWWPSDVPCEDAEKWCFYGICGDSHNNSVCTLAWNDLIAIKPYKYATADWIDTFFGTQEEFDSADQCTAN